MRNQHKIVVDFSFFYLQIFTELTLHHTINCSTINTNNKNRKKQSKYNIINGIVHFLSNLWISDNHMLKYF